MLNFLRRLLMPRTTSVDFKQRLSASDYELRFSKNIRASKMHRLALDIRKFEIELYWKRASYFWTLIGAAFAGFAVLTASDKVSAIDKQDMQVLFSCLGVALSFSWCCVNKGSKLWQENWENHVDMLEETVCGNLYKVILKRPKVEFGITREYLTEFFTGPSEFSVSRINQLVSVLVLFIWIYLLVISLNLFEFDCHIRWRYFALLFLLVMFYLSVNQLGRTSIGPHTPEAFERTTTIKD